MDNSNKISFGSAFAGMIVGLTAAYFIYSTFWASAIFVSAPTDPILTGDITSTEILDGTITDIDIASSTKIGTAKINVSSTTDYVISGPQTWAGVKTFSSLPQTTAGNCAADNDLCRKSYVDTLGGTLTFSQLMGEAVSARDALWVAPNNQQIQMHKTGSTAGTDGNFGRTAGSGEPVVHCSAISSSTPITFDQIRLRIKTIGTPTDDVLSYFLFENPPVSLGGYATGTFANGDLGLTYSTTTAILSAATTTVANRYLHMCLSRSGATNDTNYFAHDFTLSDSDYPGSTWWAYYSNAWGEFVARRNRYSFDLKTEAGKAYKASAATSTHTNAFIGLAQASTARNATGTVEAFGIIATSTITRGSTYYLSNIAGALSTTAGVVSLVVGVALDTARLLLTR